MKSYLLIIPIAVLVALAATACATTDYQSSGRYGSGVSYEGSCHDQALAAVERARQENRNRYIAGGVGGAVVGGLVGRSRKTDRTLEGAGAGAAAGLVAAHLTREQEKQAYDHEYSLCASREQQRYYESRRRSY